jgi:hypothetical protein
MTNVPDGLGARVVAGAIAIGFGWLFVGWIGLAAAVLGILAYAAVGAKWVAAAALGSLILAATATAAVSMPDDAASAANFAGDRPIAAHAASVAGVLGITAVVGFAIEERERRSDAELAPDDGATGSST